MRSWKNILLTAAAVVGLAGGAGTVYGDSLQLGNNSANIMNDGIIAESGEGIVYYANTRDGGRLYVEKDGSSRRISNRICRDINVVGSDVFFVTEQGHAILCLEDGQTEKVIYTSETSIEEMYVAGDGRIWFLTEGNIYLIPAEGEAETAVSETAAPETTAEETTAPETTAEETAAPETTEEETAAPETEAAVEEMVELVWDADQDILHFIPTEHGVIYGVGSPWDYTLYAEGQRIRSGIASFYTMDGMLYALADGTDYIADLWDLFRGTASKALREMVYRDTLPASLLGEEEAEECEECNANAVKARENALEEGDWAAAESVYSALLEGEDLSSSTATATRSILNDSSVTNGQRNMVRRAYQMHLIEWIPKADIVGWNYEYTYTKGTLYRGLPYGQPVYGGYVPWSHSLEEFVGYVDDLSSNMYTSYSTYNKIAPYYSTDCSGFVSWAWQTSGRLYTRVFANYSDQVSNQSVYSVQIGDAFCKAGSHVVMVSDIGVNSAGTIVYIDIIEETPPITKLTRYGEGGSKTLQQMSDKYLGNGYVLLRSKTRTGVTYTPSAVVVLDDENAGNIHMNSTGVLLDVGESFKLTYKTDFTSSLTPTWVSSDTSVATVASNGTVKALKAGHTTVTLKIGASKASALIKVCPDKVPLVSAELLTDGGVKVTWKQVTDAGCYYVYRKNEGGTWTRIAVVNKLTYTDNEALAPAATYTYTVRAVAEFPDGITGKGLYDSVGVSVKTPPAAPVMKAVTAVSTTSQKITWNAVAGAEGYYLYMKEAGGTSTRIAVVTGTSYTKTGLTCGTRYTYAAKAYFKSGTQVVLGKLSAAGISKVCCPAEPGLKSVSTVDAHSLKIEWDAVEGASGYLLYRRSSVDPSWARVEFLTKTSYVNTGLTPGVTYTYTVKAYRTVGDKKAYSDHNRKGISAVCHAPAPVLGKVSTTGYGQQTVTWKALSDVSGYAVYIKEGSASTWTRKATVTGPSAVISGLTIGKVYSYTVRGFNTVDKKDVYGLYDKTGISGQCIPETPVLGTVSADTVTSQKVTWKAVRGASGYAVYRRPAAGGSWTRILTTDEVSCISSGLKPGQGYNYTVRAYTRVDGKAIYSLYDTKGISRTCVPPAPVLKSAAAAEGNALKVTWAAIAGADGYRVYGKQGTGDWKYLGASTANSFLHKGLVVGSSYSYTVRAIVNEGGNVVCGHYDNKGITGVCLASSPVLKSVSTTGYGQQTVTWEALADVSGYAVYIKEGSASSWTRKTTVTSTSAVISGLSIGKVYSYTVRGFKTVNKTDVYGLYNKTGISGQCVLETPKLGQVSADTAVSQKVTWGAVKGASDYVLYRKPAAGGSWTRILTTDQLSGISSGLEPGQKYTYTVRACTRVDGKTVYSLFDEKGITGTCVPPAPVLKSVAEAEGRSLRITWEEMSDVDGYRVYGKSGADDWQYLGSTADNSFVHENLVIGTDYTYTVRAIVYGDDETVCGHYDRKGITGTCVLGKVVLESAVATAPGSVKVSWKAADGAQAYRVYRKTADGAWTYVATTKELSYTDKGLQNGMNYSFTVRAEATVGATLVCGGYDSQGVQTKVAPAQVSLKSLTSTEAGQIRLTWDELEAVQGYRVYYRTAGTDWKRVGDVTDTSVELEGFRSGQTYWFTVRGFWVVNGTLYNGYYDTTGLCVVVK